MLEASLQQQVDEAEELRLRARAEEERGQELARQLERAQLDARVPGNRRGLSHVVQALSGGVCTASYAELAAVTRDFAADSVLGRGGYGPVYRGEWGGQAVAIKRMDQASPPPRPSSM